jgi:hypothetical protein
LSDEVLQVGELALPCPAAVAAEGLGESRVGRVGNNRRTTLTAAGRKQLSAEREDFDRLVGAIHKVLNAV